MAKRFSDTAKWEDPWFMQLPAAYKLAYWMVLDKCDAVGVWKPNFKLADFYIGTEIDWDDFAAMLDDRLHITDKGYWWLTKFVSYQYGELKQASPPHRRYVQMLNEHGLFELYSKGYAKGTATLEEEEEEEEVEQVEDKAAALQKREDKFRAEVQVAAEKSHRTFPPAMLTAFCDYWTEPNRSHTKMACELKPTFDIPRRLATWHSRDRNGTVKHRTRPNTGRRNDSKYV